MDNKTVLMLSEPALAYIVNTGFPIVSPDFAGYLVQVRKNVMLAIRVDGTFILYSSVGKKISKNKLKYITKHLIKIKFFEVTTPEPFPEYSAKLNIPFIRTPIKVSEPLFSEVK